MELKQEALDAIVRKLALAGHEVTTVQARTAIEAFLVAGDYDLVSRSVVGDDTFNSELPTEAEEPFEAGYRSLLFIKEAIDKHRNAIEYKDEGEEHVVWSEFYDACFAWMPNIREILVGMGRTFPEYYDPDTSYEEDSLAWYGAFTKMMDELAEERFAVTGEHARSMHA